MVTSYYMLAIRYLKQNIRRSVITVTGVALVVMVLYAGLNLAYSLLLNKRAEERAKQDYEIVLFTEDEDTVRQILADDRVKTAYLGPYYNSRYGQEEMLYPNALYINTANPYRMNATFTYFTQKYGIKGKYHDRLAELYLQGTDGTLAAVVILFILLSSYIFAVLGVGIVRNAIHLSMLEHIRDYGNLRCIGSSKLQLKHLVFLQGLCLELCGILPGIILGTGVSMAVEEVLRRREVIEFEAGFHLVPAIVVCMMFLFDLYFIMDENVKLAARMSPVAAIRGEYRMPENRIRLRKMVDGERIGAGRKEHNGERTGAGRRGLVSWIFWKLFGIDGDYAYKNVVRNPRRFLRTIGAMIFGIAAFMMVAVLLTSFVRILRENMDNAGYYQMIVGDAVEDFETIEMVEAGLPDYDTLAEISEMKDIEVAKPMYAFMSYFPSEEYVMEHLSDDFLETTTGKDFLYMAEESKKEVSVWNTDYYLAAGCFGYAEDDLARYKAALVDGTTELSEDGVLILNYTTATALKENRNPADYLYSPELWDELEYELIDVEYMNYKVGDTIELMDVGELHRRLDGPLHDLQEEEYEVLKELEQDVEYNEQHTMEEFEASGSSHSPRQARAEEIMEEYREKQKELLASCRQQMREEGHFRTYVVEGIVSEDVNMTENLPFGNLRIMMRMDTYYDLTGTDASQATGMMYHTDRILPDVERIYQGFESRHMADREKHISLDGTGFYLGFSAVVQSTDQYLGTIVMIRSMFGAMLGMCAFVGFLLVMAALNMVNTTESSLFLRRREFAQLRVIGVSKRHLTRMVMLEGVVEVLIANVCGSLLGGVFGYILLKLLSVQMWTVSEYRYILQYHFPIGMAFLCILMSVLVIGGAIYFPIRRLGNDLAGDLRTGAE